MTEYKQYIRCHIVKATPMIRDAYNKLRGLETPDENPDADGYHIIYPDGYESWCPKAQFEAAGRPVDGMTFGQAIEMMRRGFRVARKGWNGKGMYLWMMPYAVVKAEWCKEPHLKSLAESNGGEIECLGTIRMKTADNKVLTGWLASQTDMLSEDWMVVNDSKFIRLEAGVRYPEDGEVNGLPDNEYQPKMPFLVPDRDSSGYRWNLDINIETGEIVDWPINVTAKVHYKVCDECRIKFGDKTYDNYVPEWLGIEGRSEGDYIVLSIEDGRIKNWPSADCKGFIRNVLGEYC